VLWVRTEISGSFGLTREVANYSRDRQSSQRKYVLIEWKPYDDITSENTQEVRTERLVQLLHASSKAEGLRVPHCLGYLADYRNCSVGLVFEFKSFSPRTDQFRPSSLQELLLKSNEVPSLGDRFKLALSLTTSLSILRTSGWLHKQFYPGNVLFFSPAYCETPGIR
jgi:hypothetical protein